MAKSLRKKIAADTPPTKVRPGLKKKKETGNTKASAKAKAVECEIVEAPPGQTEVISPEIVDETILPIAVGPDDNELFKLESEETPELEEWARTVATEEPSSLLKPAKIARKDVTRKTTVRGKTATKSTNSSLPVVESRGLVSSDPLTMYLAEVRKYPLLTREQEQVLARKYFESKDPSIAQDLVKANLRFVLKVAAEYSRFGAKMIDLVQEGNVGLMHAVREFNPYKGVRLITYAVWWIRGYIQEYLMKQHSIVRIGTTHNQRKLFYRLQKEKESLDKYGSEENLAQLSSNLGIPQDEVQSMVQRMSSKDVSLDKPMDEDSRETMVDGQTRMDDVPLDESLALAEELSNLKERLEELKPELSERENILLQERLLSDEPLTLQEIGEKYGITREAVRQAEVRLMKKIKDRVLGRTDD